MTSVCTVWGTAAAEGDCAATYHRGRMTSAHSIDHLDADLPADGVLVDVDHDRDLTVGRVVYGEITPDGRLDVVAVVDSVVLENADRPLHWSAELACIRARGAGRSFIADRAKLTRLALVYDPAVIGSRPVTWMPGAVTDAGARGHWPMSWRTEHPLLTRAADHARVVTRHRAPPRLVDLRHGGPGGGQLHYRTGRILAVR